MTHRKNTPNPFGSMVDIPHMSPEEAYLIVDILNRIASSIWNIYGDDMLDLAAQFGCPDPPRRTRNTDDPDKSF